MTKHYWEIGWVCPTCNKERTEDGHDPCFGELPGVSYACCGHGGKVNSYGYITFSNGVRIGIIVTSISKDGEDFNMSRESLKRDFKRNTRSK